jgi:phosphate transport system substrate-binding protein
MNPMRRVLLAVFALIPGALLGAMPTIAANAHAPAIAPTRADLVAGRYPLDRELRIYVHIPPGGTLDPLAHQYLLTALSDAGQRAITAASLGYLALSGRQRAAERATVAALP